MISEIHKWITTLDEGTVFKLIIGVILTEFIWELYLNYRQVSKHTRFKSVFCCLRNPDIVLI